MTAELCIVLLVGIYAFFALSLLRRDERLTRRNQRRIRADLRRVLSQGKGIR